MRIFGVAAAKRLFVSSIVALAVGFTASSANANSKYAGIVIDARTGKTLYSSSADSYRYPASLTKMMTLYMVFDALERGKITKKSRIKISRYANGKPPSRIAIGTGQSLSVDSAIRALVTKSANNVAAAVAEKLGGSEANFAKMMTRKARQLGMKKTTFKNASGLTASGQRTTARDMAKLGLALREHFPNQYSYFSLRSFKYGKYRYGNHNKLLGRVRGVDGIKTGYTRASGFNLVSSVSSGGRRIVAVVMGGRTGSSRNAQMTKLISRYLPKASKRGNKRLVVAKRRIQGEAVQVASGVVNLPKTVAIPKIRHLAVANITPHVTAVPVLKARKSNRVAAAHTLVTSALPGAAPLPRYRPLQGRDELAAFMRQAAAKNMAPTPNANETIRTAVVASNPTVQEALAQNQIVRAFVPKQRPSAGELATASITTPPKGWHIQIGAVPTPDSAGKLHRKALKSAGKLLSQRSTYTQEIEKNGVALYRVRFTGFESKNAARNACKHLKRKKFACLAIRQS